MKYCRNIKIIPILIIFLFALIADHSSAAKIELNGFVKITNNHRDEYWFVDQKTNNRYQITDSADSLAIIKKIGSGIRRQDLDKITLGWKNILPEKDSDGDGLSDNFENALGTNTTQTDSDKDNYTDKDEVVNGYDPRGAGRLKSSFSFSQKNKGRIFIDVSSKGASWYVNPTDAKKYFLGSPSEAWTTIKVLSRKIDAKQFGNSTIISLKKLTILTPSTVQIKTTSDIISPEDTLKSGATAVSMGDIAEAQKYFAPAMSASTKYSIENLNQESRNSFSLILKNAKLTKSEDNKKIFTSHASFQGEDKAIEIVLEKIDGRWLIASL